MNRLFNYCTCFYTIPWGNTIPIVCSMFFSGYQPKPSQVFLLGPVVQFWIHSCSTVSLLCLQVNNWDTNFGNQTWLADPSWILPYFILYFLWWLDIFPAFPSSIHISGGFGNNQPPDRAAGCLYLSGGGMLGMYHLGISLMAGAGDSFAGCFLPWKKSGCCKIKNSGAVVGRTITIEFNKKKCVFKII